MARVKKIADLSIEQHDSPNKGGRMSDNRGIVLHIAEGYYQGTISWQMNPDQRYRDGTRVTTSSTWIVGRQRGEWAQMVDTDRIAWAQRGGSATWNSIELVGFAPQAPSSWQIEACAQLLAWHHDEYGTPLQSTGRTSGRGLGHHSMDNDTSVEWGHDACPGSGVINAKDDIVRRARQIVEDEMPLSKDDINRIFRMDGSINTPDLTADGKPRDTSDNPRWSVNTLLNNLYDNVGRVRGLLIAERAKAAAERAATQELVRNLAGNMGAQLTDEQVDRLAQAIVEAGDSAAQELLNRVEAAGEELAGREEA